MNTNLRKITAISAGAVLVAALTGGVANATSAPSVESMEVLSGQEDVALYVAQAEAERLGLPLCDENGDPIVEDEETGALTEEEQASADPVEEDVLPSAEPTAEPEEASDDEVEEGVLPSAEPASDEVAPVEQSVEQPEEPSPVQVRSLQQPGSEIEPTTGSEDDSETDSESSPTTGVEDDSETDSESSPTTGVEDDSETDSDIECVVVDYDSVYQLNAVASATSEGIVYSDLRSVNKSSGQAPTSAAASLDASPWQVLSADPDGSATVVTVSREEDGSLVVETSEELPKSEAAAVISAEQQQDETVAVAVDQVVSIDAVAVTTPSATPYYYYGTPVSNDTYRGVQNLQYDLSTGSVFSRANSWQTIEFPWKYGRGEGITVAVIDTGVDGNHEDLSGQVLEGFDFVRDSGWESYTPGWRADHPHGTHVAGIIAAKDNNNMGITGVAPDVKILPVKVLGGSGTGSSSAVAQGIIAAVDAGAQILNLSLGTPTGDAATQAAVEYANANGALVVAAGGNLNMPGYMVLDGENFPAAYPGVLGVASVETDCGGVGGNHIDVSAMGCAIMSTVPGNAYAQYSGTSMATPQVAGEAALLMSMGATKAQAEAAITGNTGRPTWIIELDCSGGTCTDTGLVNEVSTQALWGAGLIQIPDAVASFRGMGSWASDEYWTASAPEPAPAPSEDPAPAEESTPGTSTGGGASSGGSSGGGSSSGGSSSGGGASSGGSSSGSAGGSGGGLNEITAILPAAAGKPGSVIALAGWGMEGTRAVYFNEYEAQFTVVNGGHVEVTVPDIPEGVYVIHAQQSPSVGRASYWDGFHVLGKASTAPDTANDVSIPEKPWAPVTALSVKQDGNKLALRMPSDAVKMAVQRKTGKKWTTVNTWTEPNMVASVTVKKGTWRVLTWDLSGKRTKKVIKIKNTTASKDYTP